MVFAGHRKAEGRDDGGGRGRRQEENHSKGTVVSKMRWAQKQKKTKGDDEKIERGGI